MNFSPYSQGGNEGFNFRVTADSKEDSEKKATYSMGFRYGEAEALKRYFIFSMNTIFQGSLDEVQASIKKGSANAPRRQAETQKQEEDDEVVW